MKQWLWLLLLVFPVHGFAQLTAEQLERDEDGTFRIVFYNVENIFDPEDDPEKRDEEFTPEGDRFWDKYKFYDKLNRSAKAMLACGGWAPPDVIGICEIENRFVLEKMISTTPLSEYNYEIVHYESRDRRGIDVGLLFNKDNAELIRSAKIEINFPWDPDYYTRDILWVTLKVFPNDTVHFFVNHWPSRWRGQLQTEPARVHAAKTLTTVTDSLLTANRKSRIVIMGDFNDGPENKSIKEVLLGPVNGRRLLVNLMEDIEVFPGSHKYQAEWSYLDQIIVSKGLMEKDNEDGREKQGWFLEEGSCLPCAFDFLLEPDEKSLGIQPKRTFVGFSYKSDGFSDHLPVKVDLELED